MTTWSQERYSAYLTELKTRPLGGSSSVNWLTEDWPQAREVHF